MLTIDKSFWLVVSGIVGLLLLPAMISPSLAVLAIVSVGPWFFGLLFLGNARILDPSLPLLLFGNVGFVLLLERLYVALLKKRASVV